MFLTALLNFLSTVAPTTSFWDCGEFIAASFTLGVPHPPGAPFYLLLGRLFSMLPLGENIGYRVNLISCLVSALTILFLYLSTVLIIRQWRGLEKTVADKLTVYGGAAVGALAFAFSNSFWFNAVEAEVYAISMFFTALVFWLALLWLNYNEVPLGNRILLFMFYVIGLSTGVHLLNVLAILSIVYIISFKKYPATVGSFIITAIIGVAVTGAIYPGIIQGLPLLIKIGTIWLVIPLLMGIFVLAVYLLKKDYRVGAFALFAALLFVIGYSSYIYIKIRSGMNPFLDENDPETWAGLLSYLNREQYGTESLFATMFKRAAPFWTYQINKMYIRYFNWQFLGGQGTPLLLFPFFFGLVGAVHHFFRDAKHAFVVLALFFMTGLAIILYVNQPDPQPRDRDYSYVGSFYAFAIWIGIGVVTLIETLQESFKKTNPAVVATVVALIALLLAPVQMYIKNHHTHNRQGNYVASDYSYNLLNTCEPDAVLYTNGDNDTFPLWYLQVVEGVRRDVRVVNLSLLNTGWFIQQIRDQEPKVPFSSKISDYYINTVVESRDASALLDRHWKQQQRVSIDGPNIDSPNMVWNVPAALSYPVGVGGRTEYFLRVQDLMILNTIAANHWKRPIYFAVTVSDDNLCGLRNIQNPAENFLAMEGLAFKLHPHAVPLVDGGRIAENMFYKYRYRNLDNPKVYFNDNIEKLLGNYRQGLIQLAFTYLTEAKDQGDSSVEGEDLPLMERITKLDSLRPNVKALTALQYMEKIVPEDNIPISYDLIRLQIGRLYSSLGRPEEMKKQLDKLVAQNSPLDFQRAYEYAVYYLSEALAYEEAQKLLDYCLTLNPSADTYQRVAYAWLQLGPDSGYACDVLTRYLSEHNDRQSRLRIAAQAVMLGMDYYALSIYEALWQSNPGDRAALEGLVEIYKRKGSYDRALTLVKDWLGTYPDDAGMIQKMNEIQNLINYR